MHSGAYHFSGHLPAVSACINRSQCKCTGLIHFLCIEYFWCTDKIRTGSTISNIYVHCLTPPSLSPITHFLHYRTFILCYIHVRLLVYKPEKVNPYTDILYVHINRTNEKFLTTKISRTTILHPPQSIVHAH